MALNYFAVLSKSDVAFMTTSSGYCISRKSKREKHSVAVREVVKPFKKFEALRNYALIDI